MPATMHYAKPYQRTRTNLSMGDHVAKVMESFFYQIKGSPEHVYHMVLTEMERPLLEATMRYTGNNQSRAAEILGLNRGTFRKKLAFYGML